MRRLAQVAGGAGAAAPASGAPRTAIAPGSSSTAIQPQPGSGTALSPGAPAIISGNARNQSGSEYRYYASGT